MSRDFMKEMVYIVIVSDLPRHPLPADPQMT